MIKYLEVQLSKVVNTPCWIKNLQKPIDRYTNTNGRRTHITSLEEKLGRDILIGMEVDHLCYVKACFNPEHLEEVTPGENKRRCSAVYKKLEPETLPFDNGEILPSFAQNLDREDDPDIRRLILRSERYMKKRGGKNLPGARVMKGQPCPT